MPAMIGAEGSQPMIAPNDQAVFTMNYDPRTVNVANVSDYDGSFIYLWIYPSTTSVTPVSLPLQSQADCTLRPPPPDSSGNAPATLVIFNNSGAQLIATERAT